MRNLPLLVLLLVQRTDDQPKPDPISDRLRFELALAQRDYFVAANRAEQLMSAVQAKIEQANRACAGAGLTFDAAKFACTEQK